MADARYTKRLKAARTAHEGIWFDSICEKNFYLDLKRTFPGCNILRPCELRLPGKVRSWKCDFAITATRPIHTRKLGEICYMMSNSRKTELFDYEGEQIEPKEIVYVEYKGVTDLSTGLALIDKNFKARIDWVKRYAEEISDSLIVVGEGTGAILTYCTNFEFCVTPIHSKEFFLSNARQLWSAHYGVTEK